MGTNLDHRKAFVRRLNEACNRSALIPPPNSGRQSFIAKRLGVTNESVNKWFQATSMPRHQKMKELADLLGVDEAWLSLGTTVEVDRKNRLIHGRSSDGAVQLVFGLMTLAGLHCGEPSKQDPRGEYVDFYAMVDMAVYPIRVTLGRPLGNGEYEFFIIPEYEEVRLIGVIPVGGDRYHFIELDTEHVRELKVEKAPSFRIEIKRCAPGDRYRTGNYTWSRISPFSSFT